MPSLNTHRLYRTTGGPQAVRCPDLYKQFETNHLAGFCELDDGRRLQLASVTFYGRNRSRAPYHWRHILLELQIGWSAPWKILVVADRMVQLGRSVFLVAVAKITG
jgi:hypothetical protein